jgi:ATP-binding cassette subfamily B multidrug efflux pump
VHVRETYREVRFWLARINAFLQENITGTSTVQLFRREPRNFAQFDEINAGHRDANVRSIFYYAVFYPAIEIIGAIATGLIIWFGGGRVIQDTLTLGTLVAFIQYSQRFFQPIQDLSEKFNVLQAAMASSERIFQLLDTEVEIKSVQAGLSTVAGANGSPAKVDKAGKAGKAGERLSQPTLAFENVWFAYKDDDWVLRDVSFVIAPGERIGIVGATGAGKTTIINLLLRFYDVNRGRITVDGADIRELPLAELRRLFGLVLQDVHLFSGTIGNNIRLGNREIPDAAIADAVRAVHADTFIDAIGGLDAPVVERGATLSVGQKQLISFARALAFNPPVLVLDEATSSVDTETEMLIRDALHVLMEGRTTIAIAHRLSTIQDMDQILVLHRGELREMGTHQELLAMRGIYHRLYELQYQSHAPAAALQPSHGDA